VPQGNLLLDRLLKAEVVYTESDEPDSMLAVLASAEKQKGHRPYVIPVGGSNGIGALGYASLMLELSQQLFERGIALDRVYFCSGSGGTYGGILLGSRLYHAPYRLIGVSSGRKGEQAIVNVVRTANEGALLLGTDLHFSATDCEMNDRFTGPAYGISTPESLEAIRLFAETEAVLLDPVYTAKAASAMIADIRTGDVARDETVLFIHTGGTPALFAYHAEL